MRPQGLALLTLFLALTAPAAWAQPSNGPRIEHDTAILQALDKVTARISTLEAPIEETIRFGSLYILARACRTTPPEETPESAAFLQIWEVPEEEEPHWAYSGWMFASSPSLAAMDHAVYDIWVLDCVNRAESSEPTPEE